MSEKDEIKKIIRKSVDISFGKAVRSSITLIEVNIEIKFEEHMLKTILFKTESSAYINSMSNNKFEEEESFYSKIGLRLLENKENRELIDKLWDFNAICLHRLGLIAAEEFRKTIYYKMNCLYDPEFKKTFK